MQTPDSLEELIQALRCLPGVGPKSATRMAYHLLQRDHAGAGRLSAALGESLRKIRHCARCNTFTEAETCVLCSSPRRDASLLCVVESPSDLLMMEQTQSYGGLYFVLMGRLSPLDGIGPREIHLEPAPEARRGRHGERSDPRDQLHGRGRGDGPLHFGDARRQGTRGVADRAGTPGGRRARARRRRYPGASP